MKKFADHFSVFTEAKFRDVPRTVSIQAAKIASKYLEEVKNVTPKVLNKLKKIDLDPKWKEYFKEDEGEIWFVANLTNTKFKDLKTNEIVNYDVYVAFGKDNENYAMCDSSNKIIIIFDDNSRFLQKDKLISVLIHEIVHGFQQHKEYSKEYQKVKSDKTKKAKEKELYHKEPIEFDAFTTELAYTIKTQYKQILQDIKNSKMPETKKIMKKRLEKFLLELRNFINSPFDTYFLHKELPLPSSFTTFEEMLTSINKSPKLWKSLKSKLISLYKTFQHSNENRN